jgi:hypothetical protein
MTRALALLEAETDSIFHNVLASHNLVLALSAALALVYIALVLKPFLRLNTKQAKRIAYLLSQLPPNMDTTALVRHAMYPGLGKPQSCLDCCAASLSWLAGRPAACGHRSCSVHAVLAALPYLD